MNILVTGAAGYIGGSFAFQALKQGYNVFGLDNFSNSDPTSIRKLQKLFGTKFKFDKVDILDCATLSSFVKSSKISAVIHFAALKSVLESEVKQALYSENNIAGTKNLLEVMKINGVKNLIFSSSASVYGEQKKQPIKENSRVNPVSHYAKTKAECENLIRECCNESWLNAISLRYFNPLGVHSGKIFFDSIHSNERNVLGNIMACHLKLTPSFKVFGNNYDTLDGSAIRDYIHIDDVVDGHFAALNILSKNQKYEVFNLGSNIGTSVFELVDAFNEASGKKLKIQISKRRESDISVSYADSRKSNEILGWKAKKTLKQMCESYIEIYEN